MFRRYFHFAPPEATNEVYQLGPKRTKAHLLCRHSGRATPGKGYTRLPRAVYSAQRKRWHAQLSGILAPGSPRNDPAKPAYGTSLSPGIAVLVQRNGQSNEGGSQPSPRVSLGDTSLFCRSTLRLMDPVGQPIHSVINTHTHFTQ